MHRQSAQRTLAVQFAARALAPQQRLPGKGCDPGQRPAQRRLTGASAQQADAARLPLQLQRLAQSQRPRRRVQSVVQLGAQLVNRQGPAGCLGRCRGASAHTLRLQRQPHALPLQLATALDRQRTERPCRANVDAVQAQTLGPAGLTQRELLRAHAQLQRCVQPRLAEQRLPATLPTQAQLGRTLRTDTCQRALPHRRQRRQPTQGALGLLDLQRNAAIAIARAERPLEFRLRAGNTQLQGAARAARRHPPLQMPLQLRVIAAKAHAGKVQHAVRPAPLGRRALQAQAADARVEAARCGRNVGRPTGCSPGGLRRGRAHGGLEIEPLLGRAEP